jgi:hypothetical protein
VAPKSGATIPPWDEPKQFCRSTWLHPTAEVPRIFGKFTRASRSNLNVWTGRPRSFPAWDYAEYKSIPGAQGIFQLILHFTRTFWSRA